jgi:hypothetical protein
MADSTQSAHSFPDSFERNAHGVILGATQWTLKGNDGNVIISVVGGGSGLYGDGVKTFEMYDFREDEPQGYLLEDEINEHLKANPL